MRLQGILGAYLSVSRGFRMFLGVFRNVIEVSGMFKCSISCKMFLGGDSGRIWTISGGFQEISMGFGSLSRFNGFSLTFEGILYLV